MSNFFDIQMDRKLIPEEYIESISNLIKRNMVEDLFRNANKIIDFVRSDEFPRPDRPIIRIAPTNKIIAEGMDGLIEISDGFIHHCLALPVPPFYDLIQRLPEDCEIPVNTPNALFSWTIAHEYWHGIRRHNTVLDIVPNTNKNLCAIEIDADLCAAASLYRWAQSEMKQKYADITIRQVVLCALFWSLRGFPTQSTDESTHPSIFERIYHIITKLTCLRANRNDPADPNFSTLESRGNCLPLVQLIIRAEILYKFIYPNASGNMIDFLREYTKYKGGGEFAKNWDQLRTLVSVTSSTKA